MLTGMAAEGATRSESLRQTDRREQVDSGERSYTSARRRGLSSQVTGQRGETSTAMRNMCLFRPFVMQQEPQAQCKK